MSESGEPATTGRARGSRLGFSMRVLLGLLGGVAVGLLFGESSAWLKVGGDVFIGLLQMAVLPYIVCALILNIGRLSVERGKRLGLHALAVFGALWGVGIVTLALLPLSLPGSGSGSFFSTSLVEPPLELDFVALFVPRNPFQSMAAGSLPAVVVFCVALGVAMMTQRGKAGFLDTLEVLVRALQSLNAAVIKLTPIGVFAIAAAAAGTMTTEQLGRLQAYLILAVVGVTLLALWVLPMLVAAFTPLSYRGVLGAARGAVITAFATGNVFVVLPMLIEASRRLLAPHGADEEHEEDASEVLVPLAYPFPKLGGIVVLIFIPFAAWFTGNEVALEDYPLFLSAGILSSFGNPVIIVPFLLDLMRLPADMYQLFIIAAILGDRVRNALNAMFLLAFSLLTTCSMRGLLHVRPLRLGVTVGGAVALLLTAIIGTRAYLDSFFPDELSKKEIVASMHLLQERVEAVELEAATPNPESLPAPNGHLWRIRDRGVLRVGFTPDSLPFAFHNGQGDLVGFDIEMAHRLAADLRVELEFVPVDPQKLGWHLWADHCDLVMSGIAETIRRAEEMELSQPYLDLSVAIVVRDHRVRELSTVEEITRQRGIKVGALAHGIVHEVLRRRIRERRLPPLDIVELGSYREFFEADEGEIDLLIANGEAGAAWTLLYPGFTVLNPLDRILSVPLVYPVAGGPDDPLRGFVDHWVNLKRQDGTLDELYEYWILGRTTTPGEPRWSILRDELGWLE